MFEVECNFGCIAVEILPIDGTVMINQEDANFVISDKTILTLHAVELVAEQ